MINEAITSPMVYKKYVSQKVKSMCWKPSSIEYVPSSLFVTGSWDNDHNLVSAWTLDENGEPHLLNELSHAGSVNDLEYVTKELVVSGSDAGDITIFGHDVSGKLYEKRKWRSCHSFSNGPAPVTALTTNGDIIVSVGEDGRIVGTNPQYDNPVLVIAVGSGCSVNAVVFMKSSELLVGTMQGHLKQYDLRSQNCTKTNIASYDQISICDLTSHPTQNHIIAAAGEDGSVSFWDMRNAVHALSIITAHSSSISEIAFHKSYHDHLFTCGFDGQIIHWNASTCSKTPVSSVRTDKGPKGSSNTWLSSDIAKGSIDTTSIIHGSLLPINSFSVERTTLIAGSDNEAIYVVKNVIL